MRAYRACLHCRNRKTRCDMYSHGTPGGPPCARCVREQRECIVERHRVKFGRIGKHMTVRSQAARVKGSNQIKTPLQRSSGEFAITSASRAITDAHPVTEEGYRSRHSFSPIENQALLSNPQYHGTHTCQQPAPFDSQDYTIYSPSRPNNDTDGCSWTADRSNTSDFDQDTPLVGSALEEPAGIINFDTAWPNIAWEHLSSHIVTNTGGEGGLTTENVETEPSPTDLHPQNSNYTDAEHDIACAATEADYQGKSSSATLPNDDPSLDAIFASINNYSKHYHPFFPVVAPCVLDVTKYSQTVRERPILIAAILSISSRDIVALSETHTIYAARLRSMLASSICDGSSSIDLVESLLILSQWVPRLRVQAPTGPLGSEAEIAWQFLGIAIRSTAYAGIELLVSEGDLAMVDSYCHRTELLWTAMFTSDRFMSATHGCDTAMKDSPNDRVEQTPSLGDRNITKMSLEFTQDDAIQAALANYDLANLMDEANSIITANLDVVPAKELSAAITRSLHAAFRKWRNKWESIPLPGSLKACVLLSYQFIQMQVNRHAWQQLSDNVASPGIGDGGMGVEAVMTQQLSFLHDAVSAAKSILSIVCSFVDAENTLRFMPMRYYEHIIDSARTLQEAHPWFAGDEEIASADRLIRVAGQKLLASSTRDGDNGHRYWQQLSSITLVEHNSEDQISSRSSNAGYLYAKELS